MKSRRQKLLNGCTLAVNKHLENEQGGAIVFVLIITAVALGIASISVYMGLSDRKANTNSLQGKSAMQCAELGLEMGRANVVAQAASWNGWLADCPGGEDVCLNKIVITNPCTYIDSSGTPQSYVGGNTASPLEYRVTLRDNIDDTNPLADTDNAVIVDAVALQNGNVVAKVSALVSSTTSAMMAHYRHQHRSGAQKLGNQ